MSGSGAHNRTERRSDGQRILVGRIWPRGLAKDRLRLAEWMKELAPSDALRRWFGHDPARWEAFCARHVEELDGRPEAVAALRARISQGTATLIFGAREEAHNNALALKNYLEAKDRGR